MIRLRLEDDQFLLSCIELDTFVRWLDQLYAAIDIAAPIEERSFPRDFSLPRLQRIRGLRGRRPRPEDFTNPSINGFTERPEEGHGDEDSDSDEGIVQEMEAEPRGDSLNPAALAQSSTVHQSLPYSNESINPETGKWAPRLEWTAKHDNIYAKLCYGVLLFKSPRKSNYVVCRGRQWYVDWATGRMVRVLPPGYDDVELCGPWQVVLTGNRRAI